jgi:hypothetical protein
MCGAEMASGRHILGGQDHRTEADVAPQVELVGKHLEKLEHLYTDQ